MLPSKIRGQGGDKNRKSAIGDLWEMLDSKEKVRMPDSPTAQGGRILGVGSWGRVPPPGWGMLQSWVRDQRLRIPHWELQRDWHLPAPQQNPSLASKGKKAPLMRLLKPRLWGQQGGLGCASRAAKPAHSPLLPRQQTWIN